MTAEQLSFHAHRQKKWLEQFQQASPRGRYDLLKALLEEPVISLEHATLAYAVASVSQMLEHHNLLTEQRALAARLAERVPEVYAEIEGIQALVEMQDALFEQQPERISALFKIWLKPELHVPPPFTLILKNLAYYGQAEAAAQFATQIAARLGKKGLAEDDALDFAVEQHRIHQVFEALTHSLVEGLDPDWKAFEKGLRQLGIRSTQEQQFFREQFESSEKVQLTRLRTALSEEDPELALFHVRLLFSRWMYQHYRLNLLTGGDMAQHALEMWLNQAPEPLPALEKLIQVEASQIRAYYEQLEYDPEWDLLDAFVFLWGLPHVYDWLVDLGLCSVAQQNRVLAAVAELKTELMHRRENVLWSYSFVHRWPCPRSLSAADFQAEVQAFVRTRQIAHVLSTDPADARLFDQDFPEIPEELLDSVGAMLDEQGLAALDELLQEVEAQMGPEAVGALLTALEERGYLELEFEE